MPYVKIRKSDTQCKFHIFFYQKIKGLTHFANTDYFVRHCARREEVTAQCAMLSFSENIGCILLNLEVFSPVQELCQMKPKDIGGFGQFMCFSDSRLLMVKQ